MASINEEIKSKFENNHQKAIINILFTANWLKNIHGNGLKEFGITSQQYNILRILRGAKDWMAMNDVKNRMIEKSPNTTRLADKLLTQEYIERKRCNDDRRVVFVQITPKGLNLLQNIDANNVMDPSASVIDKISEADAKKLSDILDQIRG